MKTKKLSVIELSLIANQFELSELVDALHHFGKSRPTPQDTEKMEAAKQQFAAASQKLGEYYSQMPESKRTKDMFLLLYNLRRISPDIAEQNVFDFECSLALA